MTTSNFATATLATNQVYLATTYENIGMPDEVAVTMESLFHDKWSMKEKNKIVYLFLHRMIKENNLKSIKRFLYELIDAQHEIHPSLLKSALIITKNVNDVQTMRAQVEQVLEQVIKRY